jgi:ribosomal protein L33
LTPELYVCNRCGGGPWPSHHFYAAGKKRDGSVRLDKYCKVCRKQHSALYREQNHLRYRIYYRHRYHDPELKPHIQRQHKRYSQTKRGKAARRRATRAWRVTHPELYAAQKERAAAALRAKRAQRRLTTTEESTCPA